jgi:oligopeptide transport system ATP-binding protein
MTEPLLSVEDLRVHFPVPVGRGLLRTKYGPLKAVDGVSFTIGEGEALGVVGESGCGKSTLGRAIVKLVNSTSGRVIWMGRDVARLSQAEMRPLRQQLQIIFQDPLSTHNPRMTVGAIIAEPLEVFSPELGREERRAAAMKMMSAVGLNPEFEDRYPHELSGGQSQRVSIARAMILRPKLVVCDEPVSALDVSTQAQVVNLIRRLKKEFGVSILFISHDLSVVHQLCDRVLVMYLGKVMEIGSREAIFGDARHPYTRALIDAVPRPDPRRERAKERLGLTGEIPSPIDPPSGCVFRTRCPHAAPQCRKHVPEMDVTDGHGVACLLWRDIRDASPAEKELTRA